MRKLVYLFALMTNLGSAFAGTTTLITLNSEAMPGKTAYLGVNTNTANQITGVFYKGVNGTVENFDTDSLLSSRQVLFEKKGYKLVTIKATASTSNSLSLNLNYLRNALTSDAGKRSFKIKYNSNIGRYELYDENGRYVSRAYVTTNRNLVGMEVGIDEFQTQ
jgi:hypothetical protein